MERDCCLGCNCMTGGKVCAGILEDWKGNHEESKKEKKMACNKNKGRQQTRTLRKITSSTKK